LDAQLTLASREGTRSIPLSDFILGNRKTARQPNEILTSIRIPRRWEHAASTFIKLGARRYLVISIVMVAASLLVDADRRIRQAAICVGSCSAKAVRLEKLEAELVGRPASSEIQQLLTAEHLSPLSPIDDIRATAAYRSDAAVTLLRRAVAECLAKVH
jgi:CO/xanthine dehydrogenase FAD-binding subunit